MCFYQSYAREMAEANGWQRLLTNSAKLVNIIAGYGYKPIARQHGALHRQRGRGEDRRDADRRSNATGASARAVTGTALVAPTISPPATISTASRASFSRPAHKLYGQSYVGKILVLQTAKGGVASAWMLREMTSRGMAPKAIVFDRTNTILAQGAAFAELTMVDRFEAGDPTTLIRTGDELADRPRRRPRHHPQPRRLTARGPSLLCFPGCLAQAQRARARQAGTLPRPWPVQQVAFPPIRGAHHPAS